MTGKIGFTIRGLASKNMLRVTVKAMASTPVVAIVLLGGIVGWQIWKGKKDALELEGATNAATDK